MNCCDDYGNCTQGRDCPARAKPIRRTDPGIEGVFTIARNGIDRVIALGRMLDKEIEQAKRSEKADEALLRMALEYLERSQDNYPSGYALSRAAHQQTIELIKDRLK